MMKQLKLQIENASSSPDDTAITRLRRKAKAFYESDLVQVSCNAGHLQCKMFSSGASVSKRYHAFLAVFDTCVGIACRWLLRWSLF
jgi:hypothetical protein